MSIKGILLGEETKRKTEAIDRLIEEYKYEPGIDISYLEFKKRIIDFEEKHDHTE